jgi:hypothetical protein
MDSKHKILIKFASRSREDKFFKCLDNILDNILDKENFCILISLDIDDLTMYNSSTIKKFDNYLNKYGEKIIVKYGKSISKIDAINRDVNEIKDRYDFDILINFSDDMLWTKFGYDEIIRNKFKIHFPDTDGNLHFNDGYTKDKLCTMSIIGRAYYDKYNYIYHPSYISLWCDNEYTIVAKTQNKIQYFDEIIFTHNHPSNTGKGMDKQYEKTESFMEIDKQNYLKRLNNNFKL